MYFNDVVATFEREGYYNNYGDYCRCDVCWKGEMEMEMIVVMTMMPPHLRWLSLLPLVLGKKKKKRIRNLFQCCNIGKKKVVTMVIVVVVMMVTNGYCNYC